MSSKIKFDIDKKCAKEGETVLVAWECGMPDAVTLTIENGYETTRLQLADSGSRAILIGKSKGKTTLRLTVAQGGKIERKELSVRVKNIKPIRAKAYRPRRQFSLRDVPRRVGEWWRTMCSRVRYAWQSMTPRQRRIYKAVLIMLVVMWLGGMWRSAGYKAGYEQAMKDAQRVEIGVEKGSGFGSI